MDKQLKRDLGNMIVFPLTVATIIIIPLLCIGIFQHPWRCEELVYRCEEAPYIETCNWQSGCRKVINCPSGRLLQLDSVFDTWLKKKK